MVTCLDLLTVYQECLERGSPPPSILLQRYRESGMSRRIWVPRVPIGAARRFFVKQHIHRSLDGLTRAYQRRAALEPHEDADPLTGAAAEVKRIEQYRSSLGRRPPYKLLTSLLLVGALFFSFALVSTNPLLATDQTLPFLRNLSEQLFKLPPDVSELWKTMASASSGATPNEGVTGSGGTTAVRTSDQKIDQADLAVMGKAFVALALALYALLRILPIGSFNVKRLQFSLYPEPVPSGRPFVKVEAADHCRGVYERERALFEQLGAAPPRELPFDLLRSVVFVATLLVVAVVLTLIGFIGSTKQAPAANGSFDLVNLCALLAMLWIAVALLTRLARLRRVWIGRGAPPSPLPEVVGRGRRGRRVVFAPLVTTGVIAILLLSNEYQASPAQWGVIALAFAIPGVCALRFLHAQGSHSVAAHGLAYSLAFAGAAGFVGLHHALLSGVGPVVVAAGVAWAVLVPRRGWRSSRRGLALGVGALVVVGFGLVAEGVGNLAPAPPPPTAAETKLLDLLPVGTKCFRRKGELNLRETISIDCRVSDEVGFTVHRFPSAASANEQFTVTSRKLPQGDCDPRTNQAFRGVSAYRPNDTLSRVSCSADSRGRPWMEWTVGPERVYGYAYVYRGMTTARSNEDLRREMYDNWKKMFAGGSTG